MKIGDKVRFLNDVGGGVIAGFPDKDTVLVRDEDGFDIPVLRRECVVVDTNDYNIAKVNTRSEKQPVAGTAQKALHADEEKDDDIADRPVAFRPKAVERRGADVLNVYLGFIPVEVKNLSSTSFEAYLVNDSNYALRFALYTHEGAACQLRQEGIVEPNMKLFLEEFERSALPEMEKLTFQLFAFKTGKTFIPKPVFDVTLRLDGTKFYKLHTFQSSDFFEEPAYVCDVIRDDRPARSVFVDARQLQEALLEKKVETPKEQPASRPGKEREAKNEIVEVDLHAGELLETTAGMQPKDILEYQLKVFHSTMEKYQKESGRRIVFIHGKGDGVLRNAVLKELKAKYRHCTYQDASFREYGFGATMVVIGNPASVKNPKRH